MYFVAILEIGTIPVVGWIWIPHIHCQYNNITVIHYCYNLYCNGYCTTWSGYRVVRSSSVSSALVAYTANTVQGSSSSSRYGAAIDVSGFRFFLVDRLWVSSSSSRAHCTFFCLILLRIPNPRCNILSRKGSAGSLERRG